MLRDLDILPIVRRLKGALRDAGSFDTLARGSGWSPFHLHRVFRKLVGETPKQFALRLRLEQAAAALLATDETILAIARASGFNSNEVFTRAFRRRFGRAPRQYRAALRSAVPRHTLARHRRLVSLAGPCIRLYHFPVEPGRRRATMPLKSIECKEIAPMPFLYVRRQAARSEVSQALAEGFGIVFGHAMKNGLKLAGYPLARYPVVGPGLLTIEAGVPLVEPATPVGELEYCELPGGATVFAVHGGPYDELGDTHAAIERWMQDRGLRAGGPHWEWYVTSPGEHPDPNDWRTHVYYPLASGTGT